MVKPRKNNVGSDHLFITDLGEAVGSLDDDLFDAQLFFIELVLDHFNDIITFLVISIALKYYIVVQCRKLVTRSIEFQLIVGQLYKLRVDDILHRCVLNHEFFIILKEYNEFISHGHNAGKETVHKVLHVGLRCPSLFQEENLYYK